MALTKRDRLAGTIGRSWSWSRNRLILNINRLVVDFDGFVLDVDGFVVDTDWFVVDMDGFIVDMDRLVLSMLFVDVDAACGMFLSEGVKVDNTFGCSSIVLTGGQGADDVIKLVQGNVTDKDVLYNTK